MIVQVRSWLYRLVFYSLSVPVVVFAPLFAVGGTRGIRWIAHFWARMQGRLSGVLLGIRVKVEGAPIDGPAMYAAKHQAMFETLELVFRVNEPVIVLKRELAQLPFWGWVVRRYGAIPVDREASSQALREMLRAAREVRASGRSVLIFPEGTRVPAGETPPLKSGFAGLYKALDLPVVPIALDSGRLIPRRGAMRPGVVTIRFGEPIPAGLPRPEIEARVHAAINVLETGTAEAA